MLLHIYREKVLQRKQIPYGRERKDASGKYGDKVRDFQMTGMP